jgi:hypothetical protein
MTSFGFHFTFVKVKAGCTDSIKNIFQLIIPEVAAGYSFVLIHTYNTLNKRLTAVGDLPR